MAGGGGLWPKRLVYQGFSGSADVGFDALLRAVMAWLAGAERPTSAPPPRTQDHSAIGGILAASLAVLLFDHDRHAIHA